MLMDALIICFMWKLLIFTPHLIYTYFSVHPCTPYLCERFVFAKICQELCLLGLLQYNQVFIKSMPEGIQPWR